MTGPRSVPRRAVVAGGATGIVSLSLPRAAAASSDGSGPLAGATLLAWSGSIDDPQLGEAADPLVNVWEPAVASSLTGWSAVAVGPTQCLGIRSGRLYGWGWNVSGATGQGTASGATTTPTEIVVAGVTTWTAVAAGGDSSGSFSTSLAIGDGRLFAFGNHVDSGMCGLGDGPTGDVLTPTQVGTASDWTAISAGLYHVLGIRGGELYAWGLNFSGCLGIASDALGPVTTPQRVGAATGWTTCSAGLTATSAGLRAGELFTWGGHVDGATGQGTTSGSVNTPQRVGSAADWTAVSVGTNAAAGIRAGELYAWGSNANGKTALGATTGTTTTPQRVGSDTGWSRVAVAASTMLAIRAGGLHAAGATAIVGLPTGSGLPEGTADAALPTRVGAASDWSAVDVSGIDGPVSVVGIRG